MRKVKGKRYSQEEVAKRIKYIEGVYYIDVTGEGRRLFGETIIESALVRLDISWVLRNYIPNGCRYEYSGEDYDEIIKQEGEGVAFEFIVNEVLHESHKLQIDVFDGVECLVVRFTNGKEMFISNSEWGEVSSKFRGN